MTDLLAAFTDGLVAAAGSPWTLVGLFAFIVVDAFFPPVPSETLVVALAAVSRAGGAPDPWVLLGVSAVGAVVGDSIAWWLGARLRLNERAWAARARVARMIAAASRMLHRRPAALLLSARYIPVGRVVVNMTAGATGFPWRRFVPLSAVAGVCWAVYSVGIGMLAAGWTEDDPLLAAGLAIVVALALGAAIDWGVRGVQRLLRRRALARLRDESAGADEADPS
jgi:membrane-associated protein